MKNNILEELYDTPTISVNNLYKDPPPEYFETQSIRSNLSLIINTKNNPEIVSDIQKQKEIANYLFRTSVNHIYRNELNFLVLLDLNNDSYSRELINVFNSLENIDWCSTESLSDMEHNEIQYLIGESILQQKHVFMRQLQNGFDIGGEYTTYIKNIMESLEKLHDKLIYIKSFEEKDWDKENIDEVISHIKRTINMIFENIIGLRDQLRSGYINVHENPYKKFIPLNNINKESDHLNNQNQMKIANY